ncbi:MAG: hypothetical protein M1814_001760 [Vezdaea aestivalis]|nr:MAG: hypothetical protein M1814_001760 [Vezdaea aestivalis]
MLTSALLTAGLLASASNAFTISNFRTNQTTPGAGATTTAYGISFNINDPDSTVTQAFCTYNITNKRFKEVKDNHIPCNPPSFGFSFRSEQQTNDTGITSLYLNIMHTIDVTYPTNTKGTKPASDVVAVRVAPFTVEGWNKTDPANNLRCNSTTGKPNTSDPAFTQQCSLPADAPQYKLAPQCIGNPCFYAFLATDGWTGDKLAGNMSNAGAQIQIRRDAPDGGSSMNLPMRTGTEDSDSKNGLLNAALFPTTS